MDVATLLAVLNVILGLAVVIQRLRLIRTRTLLASRIHDSLIILAGLCVSANYAFMCFMGRGYLFDPVVQRYMMRPGIAILLAAIFAAPWLEARR